MADPASLALGIIPLVGVAVKSYATVYKKLSTLIHYSATIKRYQKRFKFQRRIFENECHLLLRLAIPDDGAIGLMKADPDHSNWTDDSIDNDLKQHLGENYEPCLDIVRDIRKALDVIEEQLQSFDAVGKYQLKGEDIKQTLKRLKGQITITFNETKYDKAINQVRDANSDLGALREQIAALAKGGSESNCGQGLQRKQHVQHDRQPSIHETTLGWSTLCKVGRASKALYSGLSEVWSCREVTHTRHRVNLAIEPDTITGRIGTEEICMNLAILCSAHSFNPPFRSRLLPLLVKSQILNFGWSNIERPLSSQAPPLLEASISTCSRGSPTTSDQIVFRPRKRAKVVRFIQDSLPGRAGSGTSTATSTTTATCVNEDRDDPAGPFDLNLATSPSPSDLRHSNDICSTLAKTCTGRTKQLGSSAKDPCMDPGCLGYIDIHSEQVYRHSFHPKVDPLSNLMSYNGVVEEGDIVKLDSLLQPNGDESLQLTVVDKLRLARSLVQAVLQFHCTPWMGEVWKLGDLSFFRHGFQIDDQMSSPIKSLYLGVEFSSTQGPPQSIAHTSDPMSMEGVISSSQETPETIPSPEQLEEQRLIYGVTNFTLHSLGTALLQIDQWAAASNIEPGDVPAVRKLALRPSGLGPRFHGLIKKCLQCDFNYGFDLSRPQLQKAVYEKLVTPLEDMIASMSLNDDDDR